MSFDAAVFNQLIGSLSKRVADLEDLVSELEARIPPPEIRTMRPPEQVHPDEMLRLRQIELAARALTYHPTPLGDAERAKAWDGLEMALDRRPPRRC